MTDTPNRYASRLRPPPVRAREVDRTTPEGDHIFRFGFESITPPEGVEDDELFRWVMEEQLGAILGVVELGTADGPIIVTHYRFKNESDLKPIAF